MHDVPSDPPIPQASHKSNLETIRRSHHGCLPTVTKRGIGLVSILAPDVGEASPDQKEVAGKIGAFLDEAMDPKEEPAKRDYAIYYAGVEVRKALASVLSNGRKVGARRARCYPSSCWALCS